MGGFKKKNLKRPLKNLLPNIKLQINKDEDFTKHFGYPKNKEGIHLTFG